jgi:3',5'-cyclic-AMP phosphodiesterase
MTLASTPTEPLIIAQISDLHIKQPGQNAYGRVDVAAALIRMIEVLNGLAPRPALVVITGDLVDGGTPAEYAHLRGLLDALQLPLCVMPGNHDNRGAMRAAFGDQPFAATDALNQIRSTGPLDILALDSSVPGQPHGLLEQETLAWLDTALARSPQRPALIFLHHPPFRTGIWHMDRQNLTNANDLMRLLARHRQVRLVGCGHVHRHVVSNLAEVPVIICPGTSHAVALDLDHSMVPSFRMETPGLLLHVWSDETQALVSHAINVNAPDEAYPFFDATGRLL